MDIVIHLINIVVLFVLLRVILYKPVYRFLQARKEKIDSEYKAAETAKREAGEFKRQYDQKAEAARHDAEEQAADIIRRANSEAGDIVAAAHGEAREIVDEAAKKAEENRRKVMEDAKDDLVDSALSLTEKILGREVTEEDNRRIIDGFFENAEKGDAQ